MVFVRAFASSSSHPVTSSVAFATHMFTLGNENSQVAESKYVNHRELCAPLQLPVGDDVSAIHPLRSSEVNERSNWKPNDGAKVDASVVS